VQLTALTMESSQYGTGTVRRVWCTSDAYASFNCSPSSSKKQFKCSRVLVLALRIQIQEETQVLSSTRTPYTNTTYSVESLFHILYYQVQVQGTVEHPLH
jgi:hypothetical protein